MTAAEHLRRLVEALPDDSAVTLQASTLRDWIANDAPAAVRPTLHSIDPQSWRERLWTCPGEMRLGVRELAEALDRSADWVYRAVSPKDAEKHGREPMPCSRLDGVLVFTAAAIRAWLDRSAVTVNPEPRHVALHGPRRA